MAYKIYIETSALLAGSIAIKVGGKSYKHRQYDNAAGVLIYAEDAFQKGIRIFYATPAVELQAKNVLGKALNNMIEEKLPIFKKKTRSDRLQVADRFYHFYIFCLETLEYWLSFLEKEVIAANQKQKIRDELQTEYRNLDMQFKAEYPAYWRDYTFYLPGKVRGAAKYARSFQYHEAIRKYKPNPDRYDLEVMAECIVPNLTSMDEIYLVSEDAHFIAERSRDMLQSRFRIKTRCCYEMTETGLLKQILRSSQSINQ